MGSPLFLLLRSFLYIYLRGRRKRVAKSRKEAPILTERLSSAGGKKDVKVGERGEKKKLFLRRFLLILLRRGGEGSRGNARVEKKEEKKKGTYYSFAMERVVHPSHRKRGKNEAQHGEGGRCIKRDRDLEEKDLAQKKEGSFCLRDSFVAKERKGKVGRREEERVQ